MDDSSTRLLIYNIRYGGGTGRFLNVPLPSAGLYKPQKIELISQFIAEKQPDLVGLLEVDTGSRRTNGVNQAEQIASALNHFSIYQCKYHENSLSSRLPIFNGQANAFLVSESLHHPKFHYFNRGVKRLIIELETDEVVYFLVHLSLWYRHRQEQLWELCQLITHIEKPVIVAGDFNTLWGTDELNLFMRATDLVSANLYSQSTFPSTKPKMELDFVLHDQRIEALNFSVPDVLYSDHLPLIFDFKLDPKNKSINK